MPDEIKSEMDNPTNQPAEMEGEKADQPKGGAEMTPAEELEAMRAALKKANAEAARFRKQVEAIEAERKAKEEAEMTELQKAQKRAAELEAKLTALELAQKRREIAEKVGLPPALAARLQGASDEELEADAKALLESLPKPQEPPKKPSQLIPPVNPNSAQQTETDDQRRARLFGAKVDIFDPNFMKSHGGGVFINDKE
jgi:hypothetical protein